MVLNISEEEQQKGAKFLYDLVSKAYVNGERIPNNIELMKTARNDLNIGLVEAMHCVRKMEEEHREGLFEIGYFAQRKNLTSI
jgi:hypothetical protein